MDQKATYLLDELNTTYADLHRAFEELFWLFKMGDHSVETAMNAAEMARDAFRTNPKNLSRIQVMRTDPNTSHEEKERLSIWENFFKLYQVPAELTPLRDEIMKLESKIAQKFATANEGYEDPITHKFVPASKGKIRMMIRTNSDEAVRKACHEALEKLSLLALEEYVRVVGLRNRFARALGFEDYYAYHVHISEGMTKKQIFDLFDEIYERTKYAFEDVRKLEATMPGLRKPWNFGYMMSGSFTLEEDPYYDFDEALIRWGRSFAALGIDFQGGALQLDLLDRQGKYDNGFCHYPNIVNFVGGARNPGAANFTCNVVYGQPGAGSGGMHTLFHEGAHAADRLNSEQIETCLNTEWPPASTAWAETHSQFFDTMFASIEWRTRYTKNKNGESYPLDLFERKVRKLRILAPMGLYGIMFISEFEKRIYEEENLTPEKAIEIAKTMHRKYEDMDGDSLWALSIPHIYEWISSAYYHAYGLSELALMQWRKYFYEKYGYIVDNPAVGKEMRDVWILGSLKNFAEFVKLATGKELSPEAFLEDATMNAEDYIHRGKERVEKLASIPQVTGPVNLNAHIRMLHGKEIIADNSAGFEDMTGKYRGWLRTQKEQP
jgi:Zn-dependent oligopeptidase